MVEIPEGGESKNRLTILWFIWAGIFGSLPIYVLICHLVGDGIRQSLGPNFPLDLLKNGLYGVAIFTLLLTPFLRKFMIGGRSRGLGSETPQSPLISNQSSPIAKYTVAMVVSLALSESIGIYGFVLCLLGATFQTLYIFVGFSALAMFFYRPKREELETLAMRESLSAPDMGPME